MTSEHHHLSAVRTVLAQSFAVSGPLVALPGGEGQTYRAGDLVFRRETDATEPTFIAELYAALDVHGFRIPTPVRASNGAWVTPDGYSAWTFVAGHPATVHDVPAGVAAIEAFHRALAAVVAYPAYLADRDSVFVRADNVAWDEAPLEFDAPVAPFLGPLVQRKRPVTGLRAQLIHGDLNETNILMAPPSAPASIDMTPYWRPVKFALAIFAYWLGPYRGDTQVLDAFVQHHAFDQMLIRAALRTVLITHALAKRGMPMVDLEQELQRPVDSICHWVDQHQAKRRQDRTEAG